MKTDYLPAVKVVFLMVDQSCSPVYQAWENGRSETWYGNMFPSASRSLDRLAKLGIRTIPLLPARPQSGWEEDWRRITPKAERPLVLHRTEDFPSGLLKWAKKQNLSSGEMLLVAADRVLRGQAAATGFRSAPHLLIATLIAEGRDPIFARLTGQRERFARLKELVPYDLERQENGTWSLFCVLPRDELARAAAMNLQVEVFPLDVEVEEPLRIWLDKPVDIKTPRMFMAGKRTALLAVGPDDQNDLLVPSARHGSIQFLAPNPGILQPAARARLSGLRLAFPVGSNDLPIFQVTETPLRPLPWEDIVLPCYVPLSTPAAFQADAGRYGGSAALDASGAIVSRHIQHPDNARVVQALIAELSGMGYCTYTHTFSYGGQTLSNVIADLPGTGYLIVIEDILEKLRDIFRHYPLPDPPDLWIKEMGRVLGQGWVEAQGFENHPVEEVHESLKRLVGFEDWQPWRWLHHRWPGVGAQIVIVGAHLDSSASMTPGYHPAIDPAPGLDDNATGIAAVLAAARYLATFRGQLVHTVRFCFFNAEEQGMVGSRAYAALLKAAGAPVKAVLCTDMLGYNSDDAYLFEVHAGSRDPAIRDISLPIAQSIADCAAALGSLAPAQIYQGTSSAGGTDRSLYDPAIGRSDHAAFQEQGYPAVVVSEDFFTNLAEEPLADPNPNYHTDNDTIIDSTYGSDITCAIVSAVKELARS